MKNARSDGYRVHMVREYHGAPVHSIQEYSYSQEGLKTTTSMSYTWTLPLARQPRVPFQVADKSLGSMGKAVKEAFSNSTRCWEPAYPLKVETGDPELDNRFNFYGVDDNAVRWLAQQPGMRDLLLGCAEVDLTVYPDRVTFADPMQKNMRAGMGGTVGMMAMSTDVSKMMQMTIPIHDRMAQLLATTAQSAC